MRFNRTVVAALSMIAVGVNILTHLNDPREILQFLAGWLVALGACVFIMEIVVLARRNRP